ncbi:HAMP domain-containing sensor histidine kinase [Streptosporangium sp. NBC_01756]|uniref:HAMP domain-containing sensor histidine kinase n=1 Tax=Streptosporangium sp. NBC_01756 TaxID=2975950 RepID=UPI002DDB502D|nr:ATP-binding protein [Streptosporangium sp. NBC_01756]WSC85579.1 HAMP domain-containing histidine kinase [Streptosporangium sp. NBC_01756]
MTLRAQSTLVAALVTGVIAILGWFALLTADQHQAIHDVRAHAASLARQNVSNITEGGPLTPVIPVDGGVVQLVAGNGRVLSSSPPAEGWKPLTTARPISDELRWDGTVIRNGQRLVTVGFTAPGGTVYVAQPEPGLFHQPTRIALLGGAALLCVGLVTLATWVALSGALAPVHRMRAKLNEITATDLGKRVPEPEQPVEFRALAKTINETLERLEKAVGQQQRFAADVSHELRSPITALRTQLDLALSDPATDVSATLAGLDSAVDRLQFLVEDLLAVIRLDAGMPHDVEPVDLGEVVGAELIRRPDTVGRDLVRGALVAGNRVQLARLLTNLVDNAVRHAEREVMVSVYPDARKGQAVLEVVDDGRGVPPADRERVFQRFVRLADSRERDAHGSGLGLAIAREIAEVHGGTLRIADCERGARFVLRLPLAGEAAGRPPGTDAEKETSDDRGGTGLPADAPQPNTLR